MVSVRTFSVMYDHIFSMLANHQIRQQATRNGLQPGDCKWPVNFAQVFGGYVWVNILALSFLGLMNLHMDYHPELSGCITTL